MDHRSDSGTYSMPRCSMTKSSSAVPARGRPAHRLRSSPWSLPLPRRPAPGRPHRPGPPTGSPAAPRAVKHPGPSGRRGLARSPGRRYAPPAGGWPAPGTWGAQMILDRFRLTDRAAVVTGAGRGHRRRHGRGPGRGRGRRGGGGPDRGAAATRWPAGWRRRAPRAVVVAADLNDLEAVAALAARPRDEPRPPRRGGEQPRGGDAPALLDTSAGYLERAFHFNVSTAHALVRAATPVMLERRGRRRGQHLLDHGPGGRAGATSPTARPRRRWPTTPGWPPGTWPRGSGSNAVAVGSTATSALDWSSTATSCGRPWRR